MYCSICGAQVTPGLSYCNRCGASLGKERSDAPSTGIITSMITAIVLVAILGLGIMFGGAIALRKGGDLNMDVVAFFMFLTFITIGAVEIFLLRQLSRLLGTTGSRKQNVNQPQPLFQPAMSRSTDEMRGAPLRTLPEPIPSVTENTTRTLEHSAREARR
jgi:predicted nucleic acid-binding Zn ribbon protein